MQTKLLGLGILGALTLSACGLLGGPQSGPDVSGKLTGDAFPGGAKLALVGVNESGIYNEGNQQQIVLNGVGFDYNLPKTADQGIYQVIAYSDTNGNGQYDLGEPRSDNNGKYLVYSNQAFTAFGGKTFGAGWTLYNNADGSTTQSQQFGGYDLNYTASH